MNIWCWFWRWVGRFDDGLLLSIPWRCVVDWYECVSMYVFITFLGMYPRRFSSKWQNGAQSRNRALSWETLLLPSLHAYGFYHLGAAIVTRCFSNGRRLGFASLWSIARFDFESLNGDCIGYDGKYLALPMHIVKEWNRWNKEWMEKKGLRVHGR